MPDITITFPTATDSVGSDFTAYGTLSLAKDGHRPPKDDDVQVKCWVLDAHQEPYYADPVTISDTAWQADFTGAPDGTKTVYAALIINGKSFPAKEVVGVTILDLSQTEEPPPPPPVAFGDESAGQSPPEKSGRSGSKPDRGSPAKNCKRVRIHHTLSGAFKPHVLLALRGVSATYFVDGEQRTRIFPGEVDLVDGEYRVRLDLRRGPKRDPSSGKQRPGAIIVRFEFWPNRVLFKSIGNVVVIED